MTDKGLFKTGIIGVTDKAVCCFAPALVVFKPLSGDCCVFCSYGDVKCPPIQLGEDVCCI